MDKQSDEDIECTSVVTTNRHLLKESVESSSEMIRNGISANNAYNRVYERDSMERFGDDLTEEVLSYLWLRDKVVFEYVCKQWQRLIFSQQTELHIKSVWGPPNRDFDPKNSLHYLFVYKNFENMFDRKVFKTVLKKCPNISRLYLSERYNDVTDISLSLMTKHCRRVTKLVINTDCDEDCLISFATKHGQWLEEFTFRPQTEYSSEFLKEFLQMCPNLYKIDISFCPDISPIIESDSLKKIKVIKKIWIGTNESDILEPLVRKYEKTLKELSIGVSEVSSDDLKTLFAHISCFKSLESLRIQYSSDTTTQSIDDYLQSLAKKCTQLKKLKFDFNFSESNRLFFALSEFRSIETLVLKLMLSFNTPTLEGSVECLKNYNRLKHLSINYDELTLDFFANIQTSLPNIRYLHIESHRFVGQSVKPFIESLQSMKFIEKVIIGRSIFDSKQFYYQKNRLESKPRILCKVLIGGEEYIVF